MEEKSKLKLWIVAISEYKFVVVEARFEVCAGLDVFLDADFRAGCKVFVILKELISFISSKFFL